MIGDTASKGLAAQLAVAQRLVELGFEVLAPVGNHLRYDLAYYISTSSAGKPQLVRIQCKSARLSKDKTCLLFNAYNLGGERKRQKRGYQGDVEYLASIVQIQEKYTWFLSRNVQLEIRICA